MDDPELERISDDPARTKRIQRKSYTVKTSWLIIGAKILFATRPTAPSEVIRDWFPKT